MLFVALIVQCSYLDESANCCATAQSVLVCFFFERTKKNQMGHGLHFGGLPYAGGIILSHSFLQNFIWTRTSRFACSCFWSPQPGSAASKLSHVATRILFVDKKDRSCCRRYRLCLLCVRKICSYVFHVRILLGANPFRPLLNYTIMLVAPPAAALLLTQLL